MGQLFLHGNPEAIDSIDAAGNTALHYAAIHNNPDAAKSVIAARPEHLLVKNFAGELPIHKVFTYLLNPSNNVHHKGDESRKRWRQLEIVRIMLDENPETVSHRDKDGNLPLHLAITNRYLTLTVTLSLTTTLALALTLTITLTLTLTLV